MKKIDVVIGMNYGDEGKGHLTDYLISKAPPKSAVVRFNSGAQAAHTVQVNGQRQVFHSFSSGSFSGAATILSRFFVVNPVLFWKEIVDSKINISNIHVYVDPTCIVTTPYDVMLNRLRETSRNDEKHGSCGVGFGETIQRNESGFKIFVSDLLDEKTLIYKIRKIRDEYFLSEVEKIGIDVPSTIDMLSAETRFINDSLDFIKFVTLVSDVFAIENFDYLVFEGAQGLRLDQYSVDFPHVTRSSTGLENVAILLSDVEANVNVNYITRSYLTRHGAGPLNNEIDIKIVDETNIHNEFQGSLRFATHDFERMRSDIKKDKQFRPTQHTYTAVITCCDQYHLFNADPISNLYTKVIDAVGTNQILTSWGPDRKDFRENAKSS